MFCIDPAFHRAHGGIGARGLTEISARRVHARRHAHNYSLARLDIRWPPLAWRWSVCLSGHKSASTRAWAGHYCTGLENNNFGWCGGRLDDMSKHTHTRQGWAQEGRREAGRADGLFASLFCESRLGPGAFIATSSSSPLSSLALQSSASRCSRYRCAVGVCG